MKDILVFIDFYGLGLLESHTFMKCGFFLYPFNQIVKVDYISRQTLFSNIRFIPILPSFSFCLDTKRNKKIKKFRNSLRSNSGISGRTPKESEFSESVFLKIDYI
jgi:glycopeptide antibiotics resistance protein